MTSFKRTQRKYVQKAYRVRNWREYETGLRARGSLTVWLGLTDGKLANWNSPRPTRRKPDASEGTGVPESRGEVGVQDPEHHDGARDTRWRDDSDDRQAESRETLSPQWSCAPRHRYSCSAFCLNVVLLEENRLSYSMTAVSIDESPASIREIRNHQKSSVLSIFRKREGFIAKYAS